MCKGPEVGVRFPGGGGAEGSVAGDRGPGASTGTAAAGAAWDRGMSGSGVRLKASPGCCPERPPGGKSRVVLTVNITARFLPPGMCLDGGDTARTALAHQAEFAPCCE